MGFVLVKAGNRIACENELLKLYTDVNGFGQFWVGWPSSFHKTTGHFPIFLKNKAQQQSKHENSKITKIFGK